MDLKKPTLVMTECLLVYLKPDESAKILQWISDTFNEAPFLGLINYEMIEPNDPFGETMIQNL